MQAYNTEGLNSVGIREQKEAWDVSCFTESVGGYRLPLKYLKMTPIFQTCLIWEGVGGNRFASVDPAALDLAASLAKA